mmetsp:Transcript_2171/g.10486  ORF Transcript_2171/g.10486 Transcript_2171/m.10486 type:complete len:213 (-) Transcript_2171:45-683(-)
MGVPVVSDEGEDGDPEVSLEDVPVPQWPPDVALERTHQRVEQRGRRARTAVGHVSPLTPRLVRGGGDHHPDAEDPTDGVLQDEHLGVVLRRVGLRIREPRAGRVDMCGALFPHGGRALRDGLREARLGEEEHDGEDGCEDLSHGDPDGGHAESGEVRSMGCRRRGEERAEARERGRGGLHNLGSSLGHRVLVLSVSGERTLGIAKKPEEPTV